MATEKQVMTLERLREIWMSPCGKGKVPDCSQIYRHYHPNCRFHDSVQAFQGRDNFIQMCERLEKRCSELYNVDSKDHPFGGLDLNDLHWKKRKYR